MPSNIANILGSYDIFAKSFPGTIFVIGFISLLPISDKFEVLPESVWALALLITGILLLGFAFGQAIHSVAVKIENLIYAFLSGYYHTLQSISEFVLGLLGKRSGEDIEDRYENITESDLENLSVPRLFLKEVGLLGILRVLVPFVALLYYGYSQGEWEYLLIWLAPLIVVPLIVFVTPRMTNWAKAVLTPHRKMFLRDQLGQVDQRSESLLVDSFESKFADRIDIETIDWTSNSDREDVYKLVMSHLEFKDSGRAKQFQSILSFNRSMWVTFTVYGFIYFILHLEYNLIPFYNGDESVIVGLIGSGPTLLTLAISLAIGAILFMEGEKQYKLLFVDYLMADFLTTTDDDL